MSELPTLTVRISQDLKDKLKNIALEKQTSISAEVALRLEQSFIKDAEETVHVHHTEIDNQNTAETAAEDEQPLTQKELKKIRALLKNSKKK